MSRLVAISAAASLLLGGQAQAVISGFPACDALAAAGLSDLVHFPPDGQYQSSIESYWSGTVQAVKPWCIVRPETAQEVSDALQALVAASPAGNWDVAVRGGGHSHWPSNNVGNGVTIDLSLMNATTLSSCNNIAKIQGGARWGSVFRAVETVGRTVTGGREGNVGVAGLTLGGGASFHSARRGFACDDIVNYEVVLADGRIVQANAGEHADLFRALKGGGNNFGIVTRFDMATFRAPPKGLFGGLVFMGYDQRDAVVDQFKRFIDINGDNKDDTETVSFTWNGGAAPPQIAVVVANTAGVANTTSFAPLRDLPKFVDDRKHRTYGEMITQYVSPGGPRSVWFSLSFHNDIDVLRKALDLYDAAVEELRGLFAGDSGIGLNTVIQPLLKHFVVAQPASGVENVLGLDESLAKDSVIWLVQTFSSTPAQEAVLYSKIAKLTAELEAFAESRGANTPWRYLNYVNPAQDPLGSYGEENVRFLREVAEKYDPEGVFQRRVSGGFKISRVQ